MVKKKNPTNLQAPSPVMVTGEYEVGVWAGSPHYSCRLCVFDTLNGLDVMLTHLVERHSSEAALNALFPSAPDQLPEDESVDGVETKEVEDGANNSD